ncbi:hypothetical protein Trydic_g298, partial [Trypoxylus dichotomus]
DKDNDDTMKDINQKRISTKRILDEDGDVERRISFGIQHLVYATLVYIDDRDDNVAPSRLLVGLLYVTGTKRLALMNVD